MYLVSANLCSHVIAGAQYPCTYVQAQTENQPVPVLVDCHLVSRQVGTARSGQMGPEWNVNIYTSTVIKYPNPTISVM